MKRNSLLLVFISIFPILCGSSQDSLAKEDFKKEDISLESGAKDYWYLKSNELEISVEKDSGLICNLKSLRPIPMDVSPYTKNGLTIYMDNKDEKMVDFANLLKESSISEGEMDGKRYVRLNCSIDFSESSHRSLAQAEVVYTLYEDYLNTKVTINYKKTDSHAYQFGVRLPFNPKDWLQQFYRSWWIYEPLAPGEPRLESYSPRIEDLVPFGKVDSKIMSYSALPVGVLERKDRKLLWGYLDLGSSVILAPNNPQGYLPSFIISSKELKEGDKYSFDFFYKIFSEPDDTYQDVFKWYSSSWWSSDPLTKDIVKVKEPRPKTYLGTNFSGTHWNYIDNHNCSYWKGNPGMQDLLEERILKMKTAVNIAGPWCNYGSNPFQKDEEMRKKIRRFREKGIKISFYFNQMIGFSQGEWNSPEEKAKPPYKRWAVRFPDGSTIGDIGYCYADFCNDEFREWYVRNVKDMIEYYDPDGIFWDMSWEPYFSPSHPDSSIAHGMLRVEYEIYKWLQEKHPDKKVISNGAIGVPTQFYIDAVLMETSAYGPDPNEIGWQIVKPFGTSIISLENAATLKNFCVVGYIDPVGMDMELLTKNYMRKVMLSLGLGGFWGDYVPNMVKHGEECYKGDSSVFYFDFLHRFVDLAGFAAKISGVPRVLDRGIISSNLSNLSKVGSVWADSKNLLISIYRADDIEVLHRHVGFKSFKDSDVSVKRKITNLKEIKKIDLLAYISCNNKFSGVTGDKEIDGDIIIEVNGHRHVLAPKGTKKGLFFGYACLDFWDGLSTFADIPISYFKEGDNEIRFLKYEGSHEFYIGTDGQGETMVYLKLYDGKEAKSVSIRINEDILKKYGQSLDGGFYARIYDANGLPKSAPIFINEISQDGTINLKADLGIYELLTLEKVPLIEVK